MMNTALAVNDVIKIVKGNRARNIEAHTAWTVLSITELGADYSHSVKIVLRRGARDVAFYARHINRLSDAIINLNDGNPLHKIQIAKRY